MYGLSFGKEETAVSTGLDSVPCQTLTWTGSTFVRCLMGDMQASVSLMLSAADMTVHQRHSACDTPLELRRSDAVAGVPILRMLAAATALQACSIWSAAFAIGNRQYRKYGRLIPLRDGPELWYV